MRYETNGAGKGDKCRTSDHKKYQDGMERLYSKKSWQFWVVWEGGSSDKTEFDDLGLKPGQQISYKEYKERLGKFVRDV